MRPGDRIDLGHGGGKVGTRQPFEQCHAPLVQRQPVLLEDQRGHVAQQDRSIVEVAQASQPGFLFSGFGVLDQVGEQRLCQLGRIVLGRGLQGVEQRSHGRHPARLLQRGDRRRLSRAGDARQPLKARRRHALGRRRAKVKGADRLESVEVQEQLAGGALCRHRPQRIQRGKAGRAGFVEQRGDPGTLLLVERCHQAFPEALLRPVPDAADKPFEDADTRQQHLVDDQPGRGPLNQQARMVVATPAQRIQPSGQAEPGRSVAGELGEAVALADQGEMADALTAVVEIALELGFRLKPKLVDQESRDWARDVAISARKGAQEPGRSKHEGKAEAVVVAAQPIDDLPVASVQMEIPRQLVRGRSGGETGIALPLLIGQVTGGHGVRNLGHSQGRGGQLKFHAFFFAKHLCGTWMFSNMFCKARGAPS